MRIVRFSEARDNFKDVLDTVASDPCVTVIRRRGGEDVVVMSLSKYNSMLDTAHLLGNKANRDHLAKSIAQFKAARQGGASLPTSRFLLDT